MNDDPKGKADYPQYSSESTPPERKGMDRRGFLNLVAAGGAVALTSCQEKPQVYPASGLTDQYGVLVDLTRCVGCRSCEEACYKEHQLPDPDTAFDEGSVFEEYRRPTERAYTVVNRYENTKKPNTPVYRKIQCNHCNEPTCASVCPTHAYSKTKEGAVRYNPDLCFGCRYCMVACPFSIPAYDYHSPLEPKIVKCTFCDHRLEEGRPTACTEACPVGALTFGKRKDLLELAHKKIAEESNRYIPHVFGENEIGGTSWIYISGIAFTDVDFPAHLAHEATLELTMRFLSQVPLVFVLWPAIFGMIYAALRSREHPDEDEEESNQTTIESTQDDDGA
jgi:formate dehydrogenase iron-sulfur subunit